jgi:hypothetical protein
MVIAWMYESQGEKVVNRIKRGSGKKRRNAGLVQCDLPTHPLLSRWYGRLGACLWQCHFTSLQPETVGRASDVTGSSDSV